MDTYENLANAIILRAVDDYRLTDNEKEPEEIEAFECTKACPKKTL